MLLHTTLCTTLAGFDVAGISAIGTSGASTGVARLAGGTARNRRRDRIYELC